MIAGTSVVSTSNVVKTPAGNPASRKMASIATAQPGTLGACFRTPTFPAISAGAVRAAGALLEWGAPPLLERCRGLRQQRANCFTAVLGVVAERAFGGWVDGSHREDHDTDGLETEGRGNGVSVADTWRGHFSD